MDTLNFERKIFRPKKLDHFIFPAPELTGMSRKERDEYRRDVTLALLELKRARNPRIFRSAMQLLKGSTGASALMRVSKGLLKI